MRNLWVGLAGCLMLVLAGCSTATSKKAEDKKEASNQDKLVGTWEVTKGDMSPGSTVEFTKDGKLIMTAKVGEQTMKLEGTYTLEGDSIKTVQKPADQEVKETIKIKKLTDKELVTEDEKGKADEFKKK